MQLKKKPSPYGPLKFTTIDEYNASFPTSVKKVLKQLQQTIKQVAPQATETIGYNVPAFKLNKNLVYYAAHKEHIGFYPTPAALIFFKDELAKYKTSKGAVQFPLSKPLPIALIKKIVKYRVEEDSKNVKTKKAAARSLSHYHKDGSIYGKGQMLGDQMHGYWEWYRKGGVIMRSGYFDKGKQTGEWITYDKHGKVYKVTKMKSPK